jgi:hypothetical protein
MTASGAFWRNWRGIKNEISSKSGSMTRQFRRSPWGLSNEVVPVVVAESHHGPPLAFRIHGDRAEAGEKGEVAKMIALGGSVRLAAESEP